MRLRGRMGGLQARLMLTVVLGATVFAALAGVFAFYLAEQRALANSRQTLTELARAVEKTVAIGAYAGDTVLLREVVDGLTGNALVAATEVRNVAGLALAEGRRAGTAPRTRDMRVERPLMSPFDASERIGTLHIVADDAQVAAAAAREAWSLAGLMAAQAVLLALLLYVAAARLVSQPIVTLAGQLHVMEPGTPARLATPTTHSGDEIGVLIAAANALLESNSVALHRERALRAEIEAMEAQYREIFESSSAGIFVLNAAGQLINSNPTVSRVVGLTLDEMRALQHDNFVQRVFARPERVQAMINESRDQHETVSGDLELVQRGTRRRWVHCLISVQGGGTAVATAEHHTVEGVIYDVTDRRHAETAARYSSEHDALTGLKNRAASHAATDLFIAEALTNDAPLSLLFLDLDGFKSINDTHGHQAGDEVLIVCAKRMKAAVRRSSDLVGRLGGDEFLIALRDIGSTDAVLCHTASDLLERLREPIVLADGRQVTVGVSIGMACLPVHGHDRAQLTDAADTAMYAIKKSGKNGFAMAAERAPAGRMPVPQGPERHDHPAWADTTA